MDGLIIVPTNPAFLRDYTTARYPSVARTVDPLQDEPADLDPLGLRSANQVDYMHYSHQVNRVVGRLRN
jgi:hypothetical protein